MASRSAVKWCRDFAYRRGFDVQRVGATDVLSVFLEAIRSRRGALRFLQIGGNDGILGDPLRKFLTARRPGVSGVILEPVPAYFEALCRNYRGFEHVRPVNLGIHASEASVTIYRVDPKRAGEFPAHASALASFDPDHHERHGIPKDATIQEQVPCRTLRAVLEEYDLLDVNAIVIDTEGYDAAILEMLDLDRPSLEVVRFEHNLNRGLMSPDDLDRLGDRFHAAGFEFLVDWQDGTAFRRSILTRRGQGLAPD